jgi:hypothetical protein
MRVLPHLLSGCLHGFAIYLLSRPVGPPAPDHLNIAIPIANITFLPPAGTHPKRDLPTGPSTRSRSLPTGDSSQDLSNATLEIQDDPGGELILVLSRLHGYFAIADPVQPRKYATHLFHPDGTPQSGSTGVLIPLDPYFVVWLRTPERLPLPATVQERLGYLTGSRVYALFPGAFAFKIESEIRRVAAREGLQGAVSRAVLAFSAKSPAGFVITDIRIQTDPKPDRSEPPGVRRVARSDS